MKPECEIVRVAVGDAPLFSHANVRAQVAAIAMIFAFMANEFTVYVAIATVAYLLMILGLANRTQRLLHQRFMGATMALDVMVVTVLEVNRNAVETVLDGKLKVLQIGHIAASSVAVGLYGVVIALALARRRGRVGEWARVWHIRVGIAAFAWRSIGFVLMFSVIGLTR